MKNSVCYISKIREIKSIENADNIELALVEGWQCIIKKGEFKKNDNVILITEGAIIPEDLAQSFGIKKYLHKDNTVHVIKLKGIYSECLISVSYTHLRAHETPEHLVCRLLLEKKK